MEPSHKLVILTKAKYLSRKKVKGKWRYRYKGTPGEVAARDFGNVGAEGRKKFPSTVDERRFTDRSGQIKGLAYSQFRDVATGSLAVHADAKKERDSADHLEKLGLIKLGPITQDGNLKWRKASLTSKGKKLAENQVDAKKKPISFSEIIGGDHPLSHYVWNAYDATDNSDSAMQEAEDRILKMLRKQGHNIKDDR